MFAKHAHARAHREALREAGPWVVRQVADVHEEVHAVHQVQLVQRLLLQLQPYTLLLGLGLGVGFSFTHTLNLT